MERILVGALLAAGLLGACGAPGPGGPPAGTAPGSAEGPAALDRRGIPEEFLPALEALEREVLAGDEVVARAILARLLAREPGGATLELARAFERILDGRQAARRLALRLEAHPDPQRTGAYRLELVLSQEGPGALSLRPGPALLVRRLLAVQEDGGERRTTHERSLTIPERIQVEPEQETRIDLGDDLAPAPAGALAVRCRWELRFLAGEVRVDGRSLPLRGLEAEPTSRVLLAAFLAPEPVAPEELLRYALEERVRRSAALERAVRMPPSAYGTALDALAARARLLNLVSLAELVPALRWLALEEAPEGGAEAWQRWLAARAEASRQPVSTLDMPAPRR